MGDTMQTIICSGCQSAYTPDEEGELQNRLCPECIMNKPAQRMIIHQRAMSDVFVNEAGEITGDRAEIVKGLMRRFKISEGRANRHVNRAAKLKRSIRYRIFHPEKVNRNGGL